jgi:DNA transposition AAA+ family ATPase
MPKADARNDKIRQEVLKELEEHGLSQSVVARETGLSGGAISSWFNYKYKGDNNAIAEKVSQWLQVRKNKLEITGTVGAIPAWVKTPTGDKIVTTLTYAQTLGGISVIYGGAGLGKTCSLKHYSKNHPNTWIATMSPDTANVASSLEEIAEAMGLSGIPGRAARLRRALCRKLQDTQGLLIIDEAQHLVLNSLETIRSIYDATGIGLALCGNEAVYARLTGGSRQATFAQLYSRIGKRLRLSNALKGDSEALAKSYGITGKSEQKRLNEISKKPGALRGVSMALKMASVLAINDGGIIGLKHINSAWRDIEGRD